MLRFARPRGNHPRQGFSLIELLLGMLFLSVVLLGIIWLNSSSNRSSMDAYYEFMATELALEPLEVFRSFGYEWVKQYPGNVMNSYPLHDFEDITSPLNGSGFQYPAEASLFQRKITLQELRGTGATPNAMRVRVEVIPKGDGRASAWLLRKEPIRMETLIVERPR